jgi:hypothetical protein
MQKEERLENNHIAGKLISEITSTIGVGHHIDITIRQMAWDIRWTLANQPENIRASFLLQGVQEYFIEKQLVTGNLEYRKLADCLASNIRKYREMK